MKKKIVLGTIIASIVTLIAICGYFFIVDISSKVPEKLLDGIQVEIREFMSRKVFVISPENEKQEGIILYFHGGAYMAEMTYNHWDFLQKLSKDTKYTIIVPDYPLAPKYTYKDALKMSEPLYKEIITKESTGNLIIMGDSAGGGLALGLEEKLANSNIELPKKTILISPWLDSTMSNPKISEVQPYDKDLSKFKLFISGVFYSRGINKSEEYFVNPINGNLSKLKNITLFTGTYDILNPDCHVLQEKAHNVGIDIKIKEYETASHIWIINNNDDLAIRGYEDLVHAIL